MQVWLLAITNADTGEAGADVKGKWFISRCWSMGNLGTMGYSCHKAHLHISVEAEVFIRREMEQNKEIKGGA